MLVACQKVPTGRPSVPIILPRAINLRWNYLERAGYLSSTLHRVTVDPSRQTTRLTGRRVSLIPSLDRFRLVGQSGSSAAAHEGVIDEDKSGQLDGSEPGKNSTKPADANNKEIRAVKILATAQAVVLKLFQLLFGWAGKIPAWQRQRNLRRLQQISNDDPKNPEKLAAFLAALNKVNPLEVLELVDSGKYTTNSSVVAEYLSALVTSRRLEEYTQNAGPGLGEDHRSMDRLLQDLLVGSVSILTNRSCSMT